ncbi:Protein FAR1-RELATED SEQUENCE 5 [Rhynchospora pubera]|uniref:Protein FAR1-RELATED SEQUENCE 5 n=1 Tax=Rhynchospora pubera TaxID=906938 RepID=A0AAV8GP81_9POAL|nr:Protein FAR1-RELATED SEQUENCE 5 [Rhynchospora pubera]KAJ4778593.1 Protein FAR1-RELATED SEQUENCE 5 [Rhynchospora pubera]KAJ4805701.1 Protein FAR1-RELATED SEQUENCE 5 [Rhynchospora pubera]
MEIESTESADWIPRVGMEFETIEGAWDFWVNYGNKMGFGVRKHFINKCKKTGRISSRGFLCSNEGHRINDKRVKFARPRRPETRTGCQVGMSVKLIRETGKYRVYEFKPDHNHDLQVPVREGASQVQTAGEEMEILEDSIISPNYLPTRRQRDLIYGDTGKLLTFFYEKRLENPSFVHSEQLDGEERVTNIFWVDAKMCIDYEQFGDVVMFDTSNCMDLQLRPLCVFYGVNHFREIVIFGAGLLYDMRFESFKWLFETFLRTHNLKEPSTLFTDLDPVMERAIAEAMPETVHGLRTGCIMQDATRILSRYSKDGIDMVAAFRECMSELFEVGEFEKQFDALRRKVSPEPWLDGMYKIKEKWAQCYMKQALTLDLQNLELNEGFIKDLKACLNSELEVVHFFKQFEALVAQTRQKEIESEIVSKRRVPFLKMKTPILLQASRIYTPRIFESFQDEYEVAMGAYVKPPFEGQQKIEFIVSVGDLELESRFEKSFKVIGNVSDQMVLCSCNKFQSHGLLCGHALKILDLMNIKLLPEHYIMKRWTKEARNVAGTTSLTANGEHVKLGVAARNKILCRKFFKIAARASMYEESFLVVDSLLDNLDKQVEEKVQGILSASPLVPNLNVRSQEGGTVMESPGQISRGGSKKSLSKKKKKTVKKNGSASQSTAGGDITHSAYKEIPNTVGELNYEAMHPDSQGNGVHAAYGQLYMGGGVPQPTHTLETTPFNQGTTNLSLHYATSAGLPNWLGH